jgi:MFS family permease
MNLARSESARVLLRIYGPAMVMSLGQGMVIPTIPALAETFGVSAGQAAQLVTAGMLGRVLALLPTGYVLDRYGRKPVLVGGPLVVALGSALTALAPVFPLLLAAQFLAGIGLSAWLIGREVAIVDVVRPEQRGRMIAGFHGMGSVGVALGPVLGGVLTEVFGFRAVFWAYVLTSLFTLAASLGIPETARAARSGRAGGLKIGRVSEVEPQYQVTYVVLVFNTFVAMMRGALIMSLIPLYLGLQLGYSPTEVGAWFGIYGLANVLMIAPVGVLLDVWGRKRTVMPSLYLAIVVFIAFPIVTGASQLVVLAVLTGVMTGMSLGTMATYTYDVVPEHARARLQALRRVFADVGAIMGPALGGVIADASSPGAVFWAFVPLQLVAALLITFLARESLHRHGTQQA